MLKKSVFIAAMSLASVSAFATNLVTDGSFEDQAQAASTWGIYSSIPGWAAVSPGQIELRNNVAGTAQDGVNFVELDANFNSAMQQVVSTVAGQAYSLSFWYSSRPISVYNSAFPGDIVPADSNGLTFNVGAGDVSVYVATENDMTDNDWKLYTTSFTATGASTTLTFTAVGTNDSYGTSLDNVVLTAVPEPGEGALIVAGLLGIAGLARRRNRHS
jgi:hypothetical protein